MHWIAYSCSIHNSSWRRPLLLLQAHDKNAKARQVLGRMLHKQLAAAWSTWSEAAWEAPRERAAEQQWRTLRFQRVLQGWAHVTLRKQQLAGACPGLGILKPGCSSCRSEHCECALGSCMAQQWAPWSTTRGHRKLQGPCAAAPSSHTLCCWRYAAGTMQRVAARWLHLGLSTAFRGWQQAAQERAAGRQVLSKAVGHWRLRLAGGAFEQWRSRAQERTRLMQVRRS